MKTIISISAICLVLVSSCDIITSKDEVQGFIPGTYVRQSENEYGKSYDTVIISLQNKSAHEYKIERRTRYDRILDEKAQEPDYKLKNTTGLYDTEKKILQETQTLSNFTFDTKQKILRNGTNQFNKIK